MLDDGTLRRNAKWTHTGTAGSSATVFYTRDSGLLRPVSGITNTFDGILLGTGAAAGSEANGTWAVGTAGGSTYLAGGFGVQHVADTARPVPGEDDGSKATAMLFTNVEATPAENMTSVSIADGMLTVKQRSYGWAGRDGATAPTYQALGAAGDETLLTAKFDLATLAGNNGAQVAMNGPTWISGVISTLTRERDLLSTLQGLDSADTQAAELASWQRVQDVVQYNFFGGLLPVKLDANYVDDGDTATTDLESEADAIDLINRALDALSSVAKLEDALDPDGTGIFDHYQNDGGDDNNPDTPDATDFGNFRVYDSADRRNEVSTRTIANLRAERQYKVFSAMGTTDYTRFGFWRRESTTSARRNDGVERNVVRGPHGGPGTYAYSPWIRRMSTRCRT